MALQTSGAISFANLRTEFQDTGSTSMTEFYGKDAGLPTSGTIKLSDFYGKERPFATVRAVYFTSATSSFSVTVDASGTAGKTWAVVCYGYGSAGSTSAPASPVVNGTALTKRAERNTYYSDDGANATIYASPITPSASCTFSFSPKNGGYGNTRTALFIVDGADAGAVINAATTVGDRATSVTVSTPDTYSCAFVANCTHKDGKGVVYNEEAGFVYAGMGADRYHVGASKTFSVYGQAVCAFSIGYGDNNPVVV